MLRPVVGRTVPAEQARVVQLLIERVDVSIDGIAILRTSWLASLMAEMGSMTAPPRAA